MSLKIGDQFSNPYAGYTATIVEIDEDKNIIDCDVVEDGTDISYMNVYSLSDTIYGIESGDYHMI